MVKKIEEMFPDEDDFEILEMIGCIKTNYDSGIAMSSGCAGCNSGGGCAAGIAAYIGRDYGPKYETA